MLSLIWPRIKLLVVCAHLTTSYPRKNSQFKTLIILNIPHTPGTFTSAMAPGTISIYIPDVRCGMFSGPRIDGQSLEMIPPVTSLHFHNSHHAKGRRSKVLPNHGDITKGDEAPVGSHNLKPWKNNAPLTNWRKCMNRRANATMIERLRVQQSHNCGDCCFERHYTSSKHLYILRWGWICTNRALNNKMAMQ